MMPNEIADAQELKYDHELGAKTVRRTEIVIMLGKVVRALQTLQNVDRVSYGSDQHSSARRESDEAVKDLAKWALEFIDGREGSSDAK